MSIKVVELFAGVGGFRVGLENASDCFEFVFANQWEPQKKVQHAFQCYVSHFGVSSIHKNEDIAKIKNLIPKHDLLVGGFPCQDYSVAATGAKGIEGKKGVLWWEIRDIIKKNKPSFILLENVDRLLKSPSTQRGRDFGIILKSLDDLNYAVEWRVINAAEYGAAQRRRRVFIFAYHKKSDFFKLIKNHTLTDIILNHGFFSSIFPILENNKKKETIFNIRGFENLLEVSNSFVHLFNNSGIMINGQVKTIATFPNTNERPIPLKSIIQQDVSKEYFLDRAAQIKFEYLRSSKQIKRVKPNGDPYYYSEGSMSPHDNLNLPGRTMLTSESSINRSTHIILDPQKNRLRKLTQIECERLNGFPDNWTNTEMPPKFRYFCMGNALVVPLIEKMGLYISKIFNENNK